MRGISPTAQDLFVNRRKPTHRPSVAVEQQLAAKIVQLEQVIAEERAENGQLREIIGNANHVAFKPQKIAQQVAALYGLRLSQLRGVSRAKEVVIARHHAIWLVRQTCPHMSLPMIGRMFGKRDHTTVLHALKAHPKRKDITKPDPDLSWIDAAS
jgi:chromosomal replication initiation ATPase DnaA